jgi:hypothetical protein
MGGGGVGVAGYVCHIVTKHREEEGPNHNIPGNYYVKITVFAHPPRVVIDKQTKYFYA